MTHLYCCPSMVDDIARGYSFLNVELTCMRVSISCILFAWGSALVLGWWWGVSVLVPACAPGIGICIALTSTEGDTSFWVLSILVCEGGRDGVSIGGTLTDRWFNAGDSCIVALSLGLCVTFDTCETRDKGHRSGSPIGCLSGMTTLGFRSDHSGLALSNWMGTCGTCCFWMHF